jgi:hypothetical protein
MTDPMTADQLVSALRRWGVTVVEHPGWRTHNRNSKGAWGPVHGSVVHHTASADGTSIVELCYDGRSDLPGPLCHGVIRKSGVVHLVGNGRANHFGTIAQNAYNAVLNESATHPRPDAAEPIDGNSRLYGWECVNKGDSKDPWPDEQVEAIARVQASICEHHGWGANSVIGHKEGTRRKIDPAGLSMNALRVRVDQLLKAGPSGTTTPDIPKENDMQLNDAITLGAWVPKTWPKDTGLADGTIAVNTALGSGYAYSRIAAEGTRTLLAQVGALSAALAKLAEGGGLDAAQIQAAAEAGAAAALDRLSDALSEPAAAAGGQD